MVYWYIQYITFLSAPQCRRGGRRAPPPRLSSGLRRVTDFLDRALNSLGIEDAVEPAFLEDLRARLLDGIDCAVREPAFREDLERNGEFDGEVAEQKVGCRL